MRILCLFILPAMLAAPLPAPAQTTDKTLAVTTSPQAAASGVEVGIARRDGITISGTDTLITRNGVMEKLTKELILPNGTKITPAGAITTVEGKKVLLRSDQILTLAGKLETLPPQPTVIGAVHPNPANNPAPTAAAPNSNSTGTSQATFTGNVANPAQGAGEGTQAK